MTINLSSSSKSFADSLIGSWELIMREDRIESGEKYPDASLGDNPVGILIYDTGGHFSAQFMKRERNTEGKAEQVSSNQGRNNSTAVNGFDSYFGTYEVDEKIHLVTQTLEGALAPQNVGMIVTREMEVDGDLLTLRLPTNAVDGTAVIRTLQWRRIA